jgi:hypothetical protein
MASNTQEKLTVITVETEDSTRLESARLLANCQTKFPCKEAIFFTDKNLDTKQLAESNNITVISNIRKLDPEEKSYDFFMLSQVAAYIQTPYFLVVSRDGFILNPDAWTDDFYNYHYIGGPWPHHPKSYYPPHCPSGPQSSVGYGGFSLRFTRMYKTIADIFCKLSRQQSHTKEFWSPEDVFVCRDIRPLLEQQGFKWAPEEVASKFCCVDNKYNGEFGFYGKEIAKSNI